MSEKKVKIEEFKKAGIKKVRVQDEILTFKEQNVQKVKILKAEDAKTTINGKEREIYKMRVIDLTDDKEKNFNPASVRLREQLSLIEEEEGLINQKLRIEKIGSGTGTQYKVEKINTL